MPQRYDTIKKFTSRRHQCAAVGCAAPLNRQRQDVIISGRCLPALLHMHNNKFGSKFASTAQLRLEVRFGSFGRGFRHAAVCSSVQPSFAVCSFDYLCVCAADLLVGATVVCRVLLCTMCSFVLSV